jgi:hypothetical protein
MYAKMRQKVLLSTRIPMIRRCLALLGTALVLSVTAYGCSDPVPPAAQGALSYTFTFSQGKSCSVGAFQQAIGRVDGTTQSPISDGSGGVAVFCSVKQSGDGYRVDAKISQGGENFTLSAAFDATGKAQGTISLYSKFTEATYQPAVGTTCEMSVAPDDTHKGLSISPGHVWGTFTCNEIVDLRNTESTCAVRSSSDGEPGGFFIFDNCEN